MAATVIEQKIGVPPGTPSSAYFSVPEGEAGQIVNALSTIGHSLNPVQGGLNILKDLRHMFDDTVQSIKQTIGLATGNQTAWTVIHATSAAQVYALEQAGLTPYKTAAEARKHNTAQNRNVSQSGSALDLFHGLNLQNLILRVGEIILGIVLVGVGIAKLTGAANVVSAAVRTRIP